MGFLPRSGTSRYRENGRFRLDFGASPQPELEAAFTVLLFAVFAAWRTRHISSKPSLGLGLMPLFQKRTGPVRAVGGGGCWRISKQAWSGGRNGAQEAAWSLEASSREFFGTGLGRLEA